MITVESVSLFIIQTLREAYETTGTDTWFKIFSYSHPLSLHACGHGFQDNKAPGANANINNTANKKSDPACKNLAKGIFVFFIKSFHIMFIL